MGLSLSHHSSHTSDSPSDVCGNPDPRNYKIVDFYEINRHVVVKVHYPDCTNYEGIKVLLYEKTTIEELRQQKYLDPHFTVDPRFKSPFARFAPTEVGWNSAIFTAAHL